MKLKNEFSRATRLLFIDARTCFRCGSNQIIEIDHIFGRMSNSPLNASPLCRKCHHDKNLEGYKGKLKQLEWTSRYLAHRGYQLTQKDYDFLEAIKNY